ncbi:hypothetical protein F5878DRAFT_76169 [Lentinula raphanica]|uniref:Nephrocystin 3-like N-terminal domain-containing protein n=1 Tax=Lentinula raphanica TaxID=153919 RepID=A0AA38UFX3_9AGAR|nr:hypothetical protein F5878DRAFT_76169 [Lentinula raphanica]
MQNQSSNQHTEISGIFNNAQNTTVTGGEFNVAGRDMNMYKTYYYLSSDEEKKLKEWLAAPDCSINYATALDKKVAGTGQWILEDATYLKWKKEVEQGSILWIQGKGK